jgi:hypothetical protein
MKARKLFPCAERGFRWKYPEAFERTGELRPPKKGEWYLSGAIPGAYLAKADLSTPYHIMRPATAPPKTITHQGLTYRREDI